MNDLYRRFTGYDEITDLLAGSDEDALVVLNGKPALIRLPGEDPTRPARFVSTLLHGNEDSGFRAVLELLRRKDRYPFDLWVFLGNTRAARQEGWFAHRYLDDQEDFNRVWGLGPATTRMRRCAEEVLAEVTAGPLEAAVDLHNNTGENPPYAITAVRTPESLRLVGVCADIGLLWNLRINALMEALAPFCPAVAVECGKSGRPASQAFALGALDRFLETADIGDPALPAGPGALFEILHRVTVRSEVTVAFGARCPTRSTWSCTRAWTRPASGCSWPARSWAACTPGRPCRCARWTWRAGTPPAGSSRSPPTGRWWSPRT